MRSDTVKKGFQRAPHRSLLHACGLSDADINKPFIGIGRGHRSMSRSSVRDYKASKAHDVINALCEFFL
ncbi:Dihydroxy-acid dehydratase [subsurface metagenome]